ncbi:hypothetical protein [Cyanobium sp. WAJ14-Wanaka]|uniref:hypothetical protein n=1 Tax=Cyanobium sp. WAJ14-Wanaka TaxID=2823725 RepID=UPI0020CC66C3|nr:hypothetical protein [Cyanobium sp. WAJ14-Wanaka]MCP9774037.1 hypothetical protein [Cyanobium sp. WAJ14-Wanaka]
MNKVVLPIAAGLVLILFGQHLAGAFVMGITVIFGLRLLEQQFAERAVAGHHGNSPRDLIIVRSLDGAGTFLQQFTGSFFACMFWMTQGNLGLTTAAHWIAASQTGLAAAAILQIIQQVPQLSPLLKGRWRAFVVTSLVVSSVDRCIHPGHFGGPLTEALLTGMSAYGLNLAMDGGYEMFLALLKL